MKLLAGQGPHHAGLLHAEAVGILITCGSPKAAIDQSINYYTSPALCWVHARQPHAGHAVRYCWPCTFQSWAGKHSNLLMNVGQDNREWRDRPSMALVPDHPSFAALRERAASQASPTPALFGAMEMLGAAASRAMERACCALVSRFPSRLTRHQQGMPVSANYCSDYLRHCPCDCASQQLPDVPVLRLSGPASTTASPELVQG